MFLLVPWNFLVYVGKVIHLSHWIHWPRVDCLLTRPAIILLLCYGVKIAIILISNLCHMNFHAIVPRWGCCLLPWNAWFDPICCQQIYVLYFCTFCYERQVPLEEKDYLEGKGEAEIADNYVFSVIGKIKIWYNSCLIVTGLMPSCLYNRWYYFLYA